jgi:hypothetical protein
MRHQVGPASVSRRTRKSNAVKNCTVNRCTVKHRLATALTILVGLAALPCPAVEMFTFFGDGSRIGLPSLEVPVEAYPGIPLRSDRLRARRMGRRPAAGGPASTPAGAMVRVIPETVVPQAVVPEKTVRRHTPLGGSPPVAPEPPRAAAGPVKSLELIPTPRP